MPRHSSTAAAVTYMVPVDDLETDVYEIFVDPYTAKSPANGLCCTETDCSLSLSSISSWTFIGHCCLELTRPMSSASRRFFFSSRYLIGLFLWWPRNGNWRHALSIKWGATPRADHL